MSPEVKSDQIGARCTGFYFPPFDDTGLRALRLSYHLDDESEEGRLELEERLIGFHHFAGPLLIKGKRANCGTILGVGADVLMNAATVFDKYLPHRKRELNGIPFQSFHDSELCGNRKSTLWDLRTTVFSELQRRGIKRYYID